MNFLIEELPTLGGSGIRSAPERFEWSPEAMNAPEGLFNHPGVQRIRRVDNPGSIGFPTIQVMGGKLEPVTYKGTWNDRYNRVGYAAAEKRRFLAMCYRGNAVRITFGDVTFEGLITAWDCPTIKAPWKIGYEFTVELANDGLIGNARATRSPETIVAPRQLVEEVEILYDVLEEEADEPIVAQSLGGDLFSTVADALGEVRAKIDEVNAVIETRLSGGEGRLPLLRAAQAFRSVRLSALGVLDTLAEAKASTDLQYRSAVSELRFETWSRSMRYQARLVGLSSLTAEQTTGERADPVAIATYRPRAGESLYDVSIACYGTPHYWRQIADRNRLDTFTLDGTEDLVIPEVLIGT